MLKSEIPVSQNRAFFQASGFELGSDFGFRFSDFENPNGPANKGEFRRGSGN
jgi:hypothetical protein